MAIFKSVWPDKGGIDTNIFIHLYIQNLKHRIKQKTLKQLLFKGFNIVAKTGVEPVTSGL